MFNFLFTNLSMSLSSTFLYSSSLWRVSWIGTVRRISWWWSRWFYISPGRRSSIWRISWITFVDRFFLIIRIRKIAVIKYVWADTMSFFCLLPFFIGDLIALVNIVIHVIMVQQLVVISISTHWADNTSFIWYITVIKMVDWGNVVSS